MGQDPCRSWIDTSERKYRPLWELDRYIRQDGTGPLQELDRYIRQDGTGPLKELDRYIRQEVLTPVGAGYSG
jgi:hypothetical protein